MNNQNSIQNNGVSGNVTPNVNQVPVQPQTIQQAPVQPVQQPVSQPAPQSVQQPQAQPQSFQMPASLTGQAPKINVPVRPFFQTFFAKFNPSKSNSQVIKSICQK